MIIFTTKISLVKTINTPRYPFKCHVYEFAWPQACVIIVALRTLIPSAD